MGNIRVDDMFRTVMEIDLADRKFYLRALSDFDLQGRDEYALHAMAARHNELSNPESVGYLNFVSWMQNATDDQLKSIILSVENSRLARLALLEIQHQIFPFPDDADDTERAGVLAQRTAELERVSKARHEYITQGLTALTTRLDGLDHDQLVAQARQSQVDLQTRTDSIRAMESYTIYAAVYTDPECLVHYVESADKATDLSPEARAMFLAKYNELDILSPLDLKYFLSTGGSEDGSRPAANSVPTAKPSKKPKK